MNITLKSALVFILFVFLWVCAWNILDTTLCWLFPKPAQKIVVEGLGIIVVFFVLKMINLDVGKALREEVAPHET